VLNSYMDGNLVLELKSKGESELRSAMGSLKPEEAAVLALLRSRLAKEARRAKGAAPALPDYPTPMLSRATCRPSRKSSRCP
jgi:DNA topoisomerase-1